MIYMYIYMLMCIYIYRCIEIYVGALCFWKLPYTIYRIPTLRGYKREIGPSWAVSSSRVTGVSRLKGLRVQNVHDMVPDRK